MKVESNREGLMESCFLTEPAVALPKALSV